MHSGTVAGMMDWRDHEVACDSASIRWTTPGLVGALSTIVNRILAGTVTLLIIAALLFYYRPTIEYAHIDTLSGKETAISGWWLLVAAGGAVAVVAGAAALVVKVWRKNVAKQGRGAVRLHPEQREELKAFWRARPGSV